MLYTTPQMEKSECKHCGVEIRLLTDFWGEYRPEWKHAFEDGQDYHYYQYCHCQCDACKPDTTLGIHDPCPANCCDGEVAEPIGARRDEYSGDNGI